MRQEEAVALSHPARPRGTEGPTGLYPITPDETDTARLLASVERVLAGKPALLQYRNKLAGPALRREQALALLVRFERPACRC